MSDWSQAQQLQIVHNSCTQYQAATYARMKDVLEHV